MFAGPNISESLDNNEVWFSVLDVWIVRKFCLVIYVCWAQYSKFVDDLTDPRIFYPMHYNLWINNTLCYRRHWSGSRASQHGKDLVEGIMCYLFIIHGLLNLTVGLWSMLSGCSQTLILLETGIFNIPSNLGETLKYLSLSYHIGVDFVGTNQVKSHSKRMWFFHMYLMLKFVIQTA